MQAEFPETIFELFEITGLGGKTATKTLHYAASASVQQPTDTR